MATDDKRECQEPVDLAAITTGKGTTSVLPQPDQQRIRLQPL